MRVPSTEIGERVFRVQSPDELEQMLDEANDETRRKTLAAIALWGRVFSPSLIRKVLRTTILPSRLIGNPDMGAAEVDVAIAWLAETVRPQVERQINACLRIAALRSVLSLSPRTLSLLRPRAQSPEGQESGLADVVRVLETAPNEKGLDASQLVAALIERKCTDARTDPGIAHLVGHVRTEAETLLQLYDRFRSPGILAIIAHIPELRCEPILRDMLLGVCEEEEPQQWVVELLEDEGPGDLARVLRVLERLPGLPLSRVARAPAATVEALAELPDDLLSKVLGASDRETRLKVIAAIGKRRALRPPTIRR